MNQKRIEDNIKKIIFEHLSPKQYRVFVYGSRAAGRARKWSDYDIGIIGKKPVSQNILWKVEEELEESDLPVIVQVVDFNTVDNEFKKVALQHTKPWTN